MANKNKSDLDAFKKWLQSEKQVSRASSTVYASRVRKILSRMNELTQDDIDRVMKSLENDCFNAHMSCWRQFHEYCATKGITLPMATISRKKKRTTVEHELPELVTLALLQIMNSIHGFKPQLIVAIRWKNVQMNGDAPWYISDPGNPALTYHAPAEPMRILCDWANGPCAIEKERPLIPKAALSMVPMTKSIIKRSISGRKQNRLQ